MAETRNTTSRVSRSIGSVQTELKAAGVRYVARNVPLAKLSRWRIGGPAALVATPQSTDEVVKALSILHRHDVPRLVIGDGSNLLFSDSGFDGVILRIGSALSQRRVEGTRVWSEAGVWVPFFARAVGAMGLSGLEHIVGIPGTLGGLVVMNGGSLRQSIGTHIVSVTAARPDGEILQLSRDECAFGYRRSALQEGGEVVLSLALDLNRGDPFVIRQQMISIMAARRAKFPLRLPNCGSVFVSDPAMYDEVGPPGKAIEDAGLKGVRLGGAAIPSVHANFIVNEGGATAADVLGLIALAREAVQRRTGYTLSAEVRYVSPSGRMAPAHEEAMRRGIPDSISRYLTSPATPA